MVEILDYGSLGEHTASYFIDFEYCEFNLADYLCGRVRASQGLIDYQSCGIQGHLPFFICAIMQQLLSALMFIHAHGQTHRDLKPQNSMVPSSSILYLTLVLYSSIRGFWKIADFGTTGAAGTAGLQLTELGRGSSGYRAPELIGETSAFNQKSDIWCLGCIFYELCTGKTVFQSDFEVFEFRSPENLSFPAVQYLSDEFIRLARQDWIDQLLRRNHELRPNVRSLVSNFDRLVRTIIPTAKLQTDADWMLEPNILWTDGPIQETIPRYEEMFIVGSHVQSQAQFERYRQVWLSRAKLLGDSHALAISSRARMAWAALYLREYKIAAEIFTELHSILEISLGRDHPMTLGSQYGSASCCQNEKEVKPTYESIGKYGEVLELQKKVLGNNHADTLRSMRGLAWAHFHSGDHMKAAELLAQVQQTCTLRGPDDPESWTTAARIGWYHWWRSETEEALERFNAAFQKQRLHFGMSHPETIESFAGLVWCESKLHFDNGDISQSTREEQAIRAAPRMIFMV